MTNVFFEPWVGQQYINGGIFGKKILALGDSFHCKEDICDDCGKINARDECVNFTVNTVNDFLHNRESAYMPWMGTYLKFERSLVNKVTTLADSQEIWESILFYNYLQIAMPKPRERGIQEQYNKASTAFFEVLEKYKPEYMLVWGIKLYYSLPEVNWSESSPIITDDHENKNGFYTLSDGHRVKVLALWHPSTSRGYKWGYWYEVISKFANFTTSL